MRPAFNPFSKTAASRILGIKVSAIKEVKGTFNTILVVLRHARARFVSVNAFRQDFLALRLEGSKEIQIQAQQNGYLAWNPKTGNAHEIAVLGGRLVCDCEDHQRQLAVFGKAVCKHTLCVRLSDQLPQIA